MNPLALDDDVVTAGLRQTLDEKTAAASAAYAKFQQGRRDALAKHGNDVGALFKDTSTVEALEDLKKLADKASEEADELKAQLIGRLSGKRSSGPGSDGPSIGKEFLRRIGGTMKALDGTSGGSMVGAFFDHDIRSLPQRQLFVRSVIPVRQADGDKIWFLRQTAATNLAAPVAAGALKPTSTYTVERVEQPVTTIAHLTEALDRALLSDENELIAFLDNQLRLGVLLAEENQIINGNGTPPNLRGILNTAGISTQARGADDNATAIFKAINLVRAAFMEPDAIVLTPANWATIRTARDANGNYLTGDITDADQDGHDTLWGKQVIVSPVLPANTAIVGAFGVGAVVWDREQARVTFTESGALGAGGVEIFSRNQILFRGEERIAFGVPRPSAFASVTGLA